MMRVKDEEKYLARAIESLEPLGGKIILLDDGSADATPDIARNSDSVIYHRQDDVEMDEGRDRTFILREALKLRPRWLFTLDGDEELPPTTSGMMLRAVSQCPDDVNVFGLFICIMWGEDEYFPGPHIWRQNRLWRVDALEHRDYEFSSGNNHNLHCGCVPPVGGKRQQLNAFIKAWSYESKEAMEDKISFYEKVDEVHGPAMRERWSQRLKFGRARWRDNLDAREIGKAGSVTY